MVDDFSGRYSKCISFVCLIFLLALIVIVKSFFSFMASFLDCRVSGVDL